MSRFEHVARICRRWQRRYARMGKRPRHKLRGCAKLRCTRACSDYAVSKRDLPP
jgi:hypothetical protein